MNTYHNYSKGETSFLLANNIGDRGGYVKFNWNEDVQSVQPHYENTIVILKNGNKYLLYGRDYGV